jgi:hypothetical protein
VKADHNADANRRWRITEPEQLVSYRLGQPLFASWLDRIGPRSATDIALPCRRRDPSDHAALPADRRNPRRHHPA